MELSKGGRSLVQGRGEELNTSHNTMGKTIVLLQPELVASLSQSALRRAFTLSIVSGSPSPRHGRAC
jgi:hypothetical protein